MTVAEAQRSEAILAAIARRLHSVPLADPAIQSITFVVHLRSGGGWPRGLTMRLEVQDEVGGAAQNGHADGVDSCGPRKNW